jgi:hypothetical protein
MAFSLHDRAPQRRLWSVVRGQLSVASCSSLAVLCKTNTDNEQGTLYISLKLAALRYAST